MTPEIPCPRTAQDDQDATYRCDLAKGHSGDCLDRKQRAWWTVTHAGRFKITWRQS